MNSSIAIPGLLGKRHPVSSTMAQVSSLIPRKTGLPFLSPWGPLPGAFISSINPHHHVSSSYASVGKMGPTV